MKIKTNDDLYVYEIYLKNDYAPNFPDLVGTEVTYDETATIINLEGVNEETYYIPMDNILYIKRYEEKE